MGREIRRLERAMHRSRRMTNPAAFNSDGTYRRGAKIQEQVAPLSPADDAFIVPLFFKCL